jgi:hypothetical protein
MKAIPSSEYDPEEYYSRRFKIVDLPAGLHDLTEVEVVVQPSGEGNVSKAIAVDSIVVPLFKAAPDLLAALQEARDYLNALLDVGDDAAVDLLVNSGEDVEARLSAAIAKATQP